MLCRYKDFILNNIASLSLYVPNPHSFYSVPLQSGVWENKSIKELLIEWRKKSTEHNDNLSMHISTNKDLKKLLQAKYLDTKLPDKSKNGEMNEIMKYYNTYFDKDSGNTRDDGIDQLQSYLKEEIESSKHNVIKLKKDLYEIKKELDKKKAVEDNKNIFFPIIPMYSPVIFHIFLTIFSICISFKWIYFNLYYLIPYTPEVVIPAILTNIVLFVWEYYKLYSKVRKYYKVSKVIHMFCKKKIHYFYKKK